MNLCPPVIPALLTPFCEDGSINHAALRRLVRYNMKKGVQGFYCCGSTAEAFLLSEKERKEALDTVVEEVNGRCAVIAHVGAISTDTAIALAQHAEQAGAHAVSAISPFYYNFSFDEISDYYRDIADHVGLPFIVYNFPAMSGVTLDIDRILHLLSDARFIGIKHTSNDFYALNRIKKHFPDRIVYGGYDEMFLPALAAGADSAIGSTFNFMAEKFLRIRAFYDQGDTAKALEAQTQANDIIDALVKVGVLAAEKAVLSILGIDMGPCRKPFRRVSEGQRALLEEAVRQHGLQRADDLL